MFLSNNHWYLSIYIELMPILAIIQYDIYVDMNSSYINANGSNIYPFPNLSIANEKNLDLLTKTFILQPNEASYLFFDNFQYNQNILILGSS